MKGVTSGRIVHFVADNGDHLPAMITKVWSQSGENELDFATVNLCVFNPYDGEHGDSVNWIETSITYNPDKAINTWHWIEPA